MVISTQYIIVTPCRRYLMAFSSPPSHFLFPILFYTYFYNLLFFPLLSYLHIVFFLLFCSDCDAISIIFTIYFLFLSDIVLLLIILLFLLFSYPYSFYFPISLYLSLLDSDVTLANHLFHT
jgi:hypothetical protein